jgi:hypothetical protein
MTTKHCAGDYLNFLMHKVRYRLIKQKPIKTCEVSHAMKHEEKLNRTLTIYCRPFSGRHLRTRQCGFFNFALVHKDKNKVERQANEKFHRDGMENRRQ